MTGIDSGSQPKHRERTLSQVRAATGVVLIAATALLALLWIWPKGDYSLLWLLHIVPAAIFVALVVTMAGPKTTHISHTGRNALLAIPLAVLWFVGLMMMGDIRSHHWAPSALWLALQLLWPWLMALGMTVRLVASRMMPGAARKDRADRQWQQEQDSIQLRRQREIEYEQKMQRELNSQTEPTAPGRMTGLEPAALADVDLPELEFLFGVPGAGLSGSGYGAEQIRKGQAGELNFARALQHTGQLERFATFWSVHMPDETVGASQTYSSDIDCVVVTGRTIYLLDMKNYTQGDVSWIMEDGELRLIDNPTGGYIGKARSMSRNMEMAVNRVSEKLRNLGISHQVLGRVVFMPTDNGMGAIAPDVAWPGRIPAVALDQTLDELTDQLPFDPSDPDSEHIVRALRWLVKDESGSAPRLGEAWKRAPGMRRSANRAGTPAAQASSSPAAAAAATSAAAAEPAPAASTAGSAPAAAPAPAASPSPAATGSARSCEECGATFQPDWTFCWECGRA